MLYEAESGEQNTLTVSWSADPGAPPTVTFTDPGAVITAEEGCESIGPHEARCTATPGGLRATAFVTLGDLNDTVQVVGTCPPSPGSCTNLGGGDGNDVLVGGAGNDVFTGGAGADVAWGGSGNDAFRADIDPGPDEMHGGPGSDSAAYHARVSSADSITVSLDGIANDGSAGEGDNVGTDIERVSGGAGDDVLLGNAGPNVLHGGEGSDRILGGGGADLLVGIYPRYIDSGPGAGDPDELIGGAGNDRLLGFRAADRLHGGPGRDRIDGGRGNDKIRGNAGADLLRGGRGRDRLAGNRGNDLIRARDRRQDRIIGGSGWDRAQIDRRDRVVGVERFL